jgi:hypothetical protein
MRVEDVDNFFIRLAGEPDPVRVGRMSELHYLAVLSAIANGQAEPDSRSLARAVLRGVAGECRPPEVRYVHSADTAESGDTVT